MTFRKKNRFSKSRHFPEFRPTFGPLGPKKKRKKKTRPKKRVLRGQEVQDLGSAKKGPRTARGHFETGSRIKWSIGAPQMGSEKTRFLGISQKQLKSTFLRFFAIYRIFAYSRFRTCRFEPLCAPPIIFGKMSPLEMLFRQRVSCCVSPTSHKPCHRPTLEDSCIMNASGDVVG